jgi:hypothetical protein
MEAVRTTETSSIPTSLHGAISQKVLISIIVSDYRLDDRAIGVRSPSEVKDFCPSLCVQTGSEAHPASYLTVTVVLSPGVKRGRGVTLASHSHLVPRSRIGKTCTSSPPHAPPWRVVGLLYFLLSSPYSPP